MSTFKIGDRVQLTTEALKTCDPAISGSESRGTVMGMALDGFRLLIEFDDGKTEWYSGVLFELERRQ